MTRNTTEGYALGYLSVTLNVSAMSSSLTAYDDLSTTDEMVADCRETERRLAFTSVARDALRPAPSLRFEDQRQGLPKRDIDLLEAAQRISGALGLDLD
jgi:hypothetical protein